MLTLFLNDSGTVTEAASLDEAMTQKRLKPSLGLWVDVDNVTRDEWKRIADALRLHPLVVTAIERAHPRWPTHRVFGEQVLLALRSYHRRGSVTMDDFARITLVIGPGFLVTYHHQPVQALQTVRESLAENGTIEAVPHGITLAILDAIAEGLMEASEGLEQQAVELETRLLSRGGGNMPQRLLEIRRTGIRLRRMLALQVDALQRLAHTDTAIVDAAEKIRLQDILQRVSHAEGLSDSVVLVNESALNAYLAVVNNRLNDVMKVLTIVGSIFLPLMFLASVYGTNFDPLPGAKTRFGFWVFVGVSVALVLTMVTYLRHLGWMKREDEPRLEGPGRGGVPHGGHSRDDHP